MADVEKGSHGFKEKIELKQSSNAVALNTTTAETQKDVFLNPEGALKKTEQKLLNEELESIHLIFPGAAGIGEEPTLIDDGGSINIRKQRATWQSLWE